MTLAGAPDKTAPGSISFWRDYTLSGARMQILAQAARPFRASLRRARLSQYSFASMVNQQARALCSATATSPLLPVLARAAAYSENTAVVSESGEYTYQELFADSAHLADVLRSAGPFGDIETENLAVELLRNEAEGKAAPTLNEVAALIPRAVDDLGGRRVAFMCPPDAAYVVSLWAIWRAGGVTVPLCTTHPTDELRYVLQDSGADLLLIHPLYAGLLDPLAEELGIKTVDYVQAMRNAPAPTLPGSERVPPNRRDAPVALNLDRWAHIVYTSGTTGRPKGVVHTHAAIEAQVVDLVDAWGWRSNDRILHFLPLHHTHGARATFTEPHGSIATLI